MSSYGEHFLALAAAVALFGPAPSAAAADAWIVSAAESKISYGSIKKGVVGEVNHFSGLSGRAGADGAVQVAIDLATVETWIDIRNERMRALVFDAVGAKTATLSAQIDMAEIDALAPGETTTIYVEGALAFGPKTLDIETDFFVARLSETRALVATDEMIMISTADLGVDPGVDALMAVAELPSITRVAPVTVRLIFDRVDEKS